MVVSVRTMASGARIRVGEYSEAIRDRSYGGPSHRLLITVPDPEDRVAQISLEFGRDWRSSRQLTMPQRRFAVDGLRLGAAAEVGR